MQQGVFGFGARACGPASVRDLAAGAAPGEPGFGAYRPAQPAGRLGGGRVVLQQPDPDGLLQVGGFDSRTRGLRRRLGGEQRAQFVQEIGVLQQVHAGRDARAVPGGFHTRHSPPVRDIPLIR
ncbi:hypothetical protein ACS04_27585 [Streptomyces roseus]|uniref:Uncharacterized protein n=1 Tax=Streptomyces roseus TaxID=66430 RepID=A0A0J6XHP7_9ACTN|nr:hypothetical protein ACS04_27585 [Streptomyces roseus]